MMSFCREVIVFLKFGWRFIEGTYYNGILCTYVCSGVHVSAYDLVRSVITCRLIHWFGALIIV